MSDTLNKHSLTVVFLKIPKHIKFQYKLDQMTSKSLALAQ